MGHKRGKLARFEDGVKAMSAHEREALRRAMQAAQEDPAMLSCITAIAAARGEAVRKRASDRRTDAARRTLVGARVPREAAARCREAAMAQGISLYAWVCKALEQAAGREANKRG